MTLHPCRVALAAALLFSATTVFAGPADDARALMAQGQYAQALQKLDQHLAKNPQDAEARFSRGIALTKLNRTGDAMKVFTDLTRDYPQLPEPYNNLAVLYAQQGDYEKARDALEAALATHPSYATAHENLGDIYSALAGASYNRAIKLDPSNTAVRAKLNLISQVENPGSSTSAPSKAAAAPAPTAKPAAQTPAPAVSNAVVPAATAPAPNKADASDTSVDAATSAAVAGLLGSWTQAWSSKDAAAYLALYADDFAPEGGQLRAAWAEQRRDRILKPAHIEVSINNSKIVRLGEDKVRVNFRQHYVSDSYSDNVNKILELKQVNGVWKITREYSR